MLLATCSQVLAGEVSPCRFHPFFFFEFSLRRALQQDKLTALHTSEAFVAFTGPDDISEDMIGHETSTFVPALADVCKRFSRTVPNQADLATGAAKETMLLLGTVWCKYATRLHTDLYKPAEACAQQLISESDPIALSSPPWQFFSGKLIALVNLFDTGCPGSCIMEVLRMAHIAGRKEGAVACDRISTFIAFVPRIQQPSNPINHLTLPFFLW